MLCILFLVLPWHILPSQMERERGKWGGMFWGRSNDAHLTYSYYGTKVYKTDLICLIEKVTHQRKLRIRKQG